MAALPPAHPDDLAQGIALLARWQQYRRQHPGGSEQDFALWLRGQPLAPAAPEPAPLHGAEEWQRLQTQKNQGHHAPQWQELPPLRRLGIHITRIARLIRIFARHAFAHLPIQSLEEYTFLIMCYKMGTPTKSELIQANLMEASSGTEVIRRLLKLGMLRQYADAQDRRTKRLELTPAGEQTLYECMLRMGAVSEEMTSGLPQADGPIMAARLWEVEEKMTRHWLSRTFATRPSPPDQA